MNSSSLLKTCLEVVFQHFNHDIFDHDDFLSLSPSFSAESSFSAKSFIQLDSEHTKQKKQNKKKQKTTISKEQKFLIFLSESYIPATNRFQDCCHQNICLSGCRLLKKIHYFVNYICEPHENVVLAKKTVLGKKTVLAKKTGKNDKDFAKIAENDEKQFSKTITCMIKSCCTYCLENLKNIFFATRKKQLDESLPLFSTVLAKSSSCYNSEEQKIDDEIALGLALAKNNDDDMMMMNYRYDIDSDLFLSTHFPDKLFRFIGSSIILQTIDIFFHGSDNFGDFPSKKKKYFYDIINFFLCPQLLEIIVFNTINNSRNEDVINALFSCLSFKIDRSLYLRFISSAIRAGNIWMLIVLSMNTTFDTVMMNYGISAKNDSALAQKTAENDLDKEKIFGNQNNRGGVDIFKKSRTRWEIFFHRSITENNLAENNFLAEEAENNDDDDDNFYRDSLFAQLFIRLSKQEMKWLLINNEQHQPISSFSLRTLIIMFKNTHPFMLQSKQALDFLTVGNLDAVGVMLIVFCEELLENQITWDDFFNENDENVSLVTFSKLLSENHIVQQKLLKRKSKFNKTGTKKTFLAENDLADLAKKEKEEEEQVLSEDELADEDDLDIWDIIECFSLFHTTL